MPDIVAMFGNSSFQLPTRLSDVFVSASGRVVCDADMFDARICGPTEVVRFTLAALMQTVLIVLLMVVSECSLFILIAVVKLFKFTFYTSFFPSFGFIN